MTFLFLLNVLALDVALCFFIELWMDEIITAIYILEIIITVLGAFILLISTFGTYKTVITYKMPYGDKTTHTIKIGLDK